MSGFRIEVEAAKAMATLHDEAAGLITDLGPSEPSGLDGGVGWPYLLDILSASSVDAGTIAQLNTSVASRVRTAVDLVTGYDAAAADTFRELEKGMP